MAVGSNPGVAMRSWSLVVTLFPSSCALAQEASPVIHGGWAATEGFTRVFRGTWTGQASPDKPNMAQGSWTLLNETGQILQEGTWSAQKARTGWQGTWTATAQGRPFSGTWSADIDESTGKTLKEMLAWSMEKDITGSWRSGRYEGNWRLKGSPP
jgi:hypothetical protein